MYKSKRSQACDITKKVRDRVWERDGGRCIICGNHQAMPNSHFIRRSQGGLGIEENIVTMCHLCHSMYDQGSDRRTIEAYTEKYLKSHYPNWDRSKLIYKKWDI
jgi:5-methylcytosine-specific restriction endonuclease McrA